MIKKLQQIGIVLLSVISLLTLIISCSKEQDGYYNYKETMPLSYDILFKIRNNPYYYPSYTEANKAIDYNGDGTKDKDIFDQMPPCFQQTPLNLIKEDGDYLYEYAMDDLYEDFEKENCKQINSKGTFKIKGNNIIFTDDKGKIWDTWDNVRLEQDGREKKDKFIRIYFSRRWISKDGHDTTIIKYCWILDIIHHKR